MRIGNNKEWELSVCDSCAYFIIDHLGEWVAIQHKSLYYCIDYLEDAHTRVREPHKPSKLYDDDWIRRQWTSANRATAVAFHKWSKTELK
jgi:hypothetical protein